MANRRLDLDVVTTGDTSGLAKTAAGLEAVARAIDEVGDQARQSARAADELGDQLAEAGRASMREVGSTIITEISGSLAKAPGVVGKYFEATGPIGAVVAAGIGAALSTAVLTAVSGGALSAAAGAGLATGIAGAVNDQQVAAAVVDLGNTMTRELSDIGRPFVLPVLDGIRTIKSEIATLGLDEIFAPLAPTIDDIANGLADMVDAALPGIEDLVAAAEPFIDQVVADMPMIGEAVGDFASHLAEAGPGAAKLFHTFVSYGAGALEVLGFLVEYSGKFLDLVGRAVEKFTPLDFDDGNSKKMSKFGEAGSTAMALVSGATEKANADLQTLETTLNALNGTALTLSETESAYQAALDAATDSANKNGATLDLHSAQGRANEAALRQIVDTTTQFAQATYDSALANGTATIASREAAATYEAGRQAFINSASSMGLTRAQAEALADRMMRKPPDWHFKPTMDTSWVEAAVAKVKALVSSMPNQVGYGQAGTYAEYYYQQNAGKRERGGPVEAGQAYVVGEKRPELFIPDQSGMILPEVPAPGRAIPWSGGGGGTTINVTIQAGLVASQEELAASVAALLRRYVQDSGPMPELVATS
jgi:hypothetical protein